MIYVLGSLNMDLVFNLPYIPLAGETLSALSFSCGAGGKGLNQAVAIAKLGGAVEMAGCVGSDEYGTGLKTALAEAGVGNKNVRVCDGSSGIAAIMVENGENRIVLYSGANACVDNAAVQTGLQNAKSGDILVVQLEIPLSVVRYALRLAKEKGMTTLLNPAPAVALDKEIFSLCDIIAPNETEAKILTGILPDNAKNARTCAEKLVDMGAKNALITLGADGAVVYDGKNFHKIDAVRVRAVDTTAAGDTFIGALAVCLSLRGTVLNACRFAACAASVTVTRKGASESIPTLQEAQAVYEKHYPEKADGKAKEFNSKKERL